LRTVPALLVTALWLAGALALQAQAPAAAPKQSSTPQADPKVNAQAGALAQFQANLQAYLQLRENLSRKLKPLSPTASSAELTARQDALAAALKQALSGARRGDLIPAEAGRQIQQTIAADFDRRRPAATKAVFDEVPVGLRPAVNKTLPDTTALATMPPLLLRNLPVLPDNLQYRLLQRDVIILDGDTRLIIDYLPNVLPAH
jgi:hypothetical protein